MKHPSYRDPYLTVIQRFNRTGVRYVVVGMMGINYYAKNASGTFATMDYDIFLEPTLDNVGKALHGLKSQGFSIGTKSGALEFPGKAAAAGLKQIIRDRATLVATTPEGLMVELLLAVSGYPFSELAKDCKTFVIRGVPVRVGKLSKLLRSKQLAGRTKDKRFLHRYQSLLEEEKD